MGVPVKVRKLSFRGLQKPTVGSSGRGLITLQTPSSPVSFSSLQLSRSAGLPQHPPRCTPHYSALRTSTARASRRASQPGQGSTEPRSPAPGRQPCLCCTIHPKHPDHFHPNATLSTVLAWGGNPAPPSCPKPISLLSGAHVRGVKQKLSQWLITPRRAAPSADLTVLPRKSGKEALEKIKSLASSPASWLHRGSHIYLSRSRPSPSFSRLLDQHLP
jgi:hypothetical protein